MKPSIRRIKKYRKFSEELKRSIVKDYENGSYSSLQLAKLHDVTATSIYKWIYKFSTYNEKGYRVVEMKDSTSSKVKELERKITELEQKVGQKQIKIDYLEKMMDMAKDELNIDIKKNFATPQSTDSDKTRRK